MGLVLITLIMFQPRMVDTLSCGKEELSNSIKILCEIKELKTDKKYESAFLAIINAYSKYITIDTLVSIKDIGAWPSWSKDNSRIAYISDKSGAQEIWVLNVGNKTIKQITNNKNKKKHPVWDYAGQNIYYIEKDNGKWLLKTINLTSKGMKEIRVDGNYHDPEILPGDTSIAYSKITRNKNKILHKESWNEAKVFVGKINDRTSDRELCADIDGIKRNPRVSKNGKYLLFEYSSSDTIDPISSILMLYDFNTGKTLKITKPEDNCWGGSWSKNDSCILYFINNPILYKRCLDLPRRLYPTISEKTFPEMHNVKGQSTTIRIPKLYLMNIKIDNDSIEVINNHDILDKQFKYPNVYYKMLNSYPWPKGFDSR